MIVCIRIACGVSRWKIVCSTLIGGRPGFCALYDGIYVTILVRIAYAFMLLRLNILYNTYNLYTQNTLLT